MIRIYFSVKSQQTKKIEVFSQGINNSKILRCETLYIGNFEYVNISSFAVLSIKLWLEENDDLNINDLLLSIKLWLEENGDLNINDPLFIQVHSVKSSFSQKLKIDAKCYHLLALTSYPT